jgi:small subunit ribosomal protein S6
LRKYETVFILDPGSDDATRDKEIKKVEELIEKNKGKIIQTDRWGMRRLHYRIKKKNEGYYVLIQFEAPVALNRELDRYYKLNEDLLRYIIVQQKDKTKLLEKDKKYPDIEGSKEKVEA